MARILTPLAAARTAAFLGYTAAMLGGVRARTRGLAPDERARVFDRWMRRWSRRLLRIFGVELQATGAIPPRGARARLVVASHRSPVDIPILLAHFGGHTLSRADLEGWPLLGAAARDAGTIFVDRTQKASGASAIRTIRRLLAEGATVIVFPEGTTFAGDEVHPFHAGAFAAARGLDVEIVPVGLAYDPGCEFVDETFPAHLARVAARPRTRVGMAIGEPRLAAGPTAALFESTRADVQRLVLRARDIQQSMLHSRK
jgi:1-acyl-sn-glycerol-3-phosphate acyltransferase